MMRIFLRRASILALSIIFTPSLTPWAAAQERRFAVVSLYNQTPDVTVHFNYHWGNDNWVGNNTLGPGQARWFGVRLDGNGRAPEFAITINEAIGAAQRVDKVFRLNWQAAPDEGIQFGHKHAIRRDANDRDYVTVFDIGPADVR
jgi:hypothetical protein